MKITFLGAARDVTGSKHIVEMGDFRLLLDCGMYQGRRQEAYVLNKALPFEAKSVTAAILSHAHADHCALLPLLAKDGYEGKVYATSATADIARLIMLDSARLQASDYEHLLSAGVSESELHAPLYTTEDVEKICGHFVHAEYSRTIPGWHDLNSTARFKFYDAGHILGSALTVVESGEGESVKRLCFTGDLGNGGVPILHDPEQIPEEIDALITECTYGDKIHRPIEEVDSLLIEVMNDAVRNKKKIIVPAFALGRTQELIYILHRLHNEGKIPAIPIYIDSPLSNSITEVFNAHKEDFDSEAWTDFMNNHESPFAFENLKYVSTKEESKALNNAEGPLMIIASSGMAEGGRILHHLEHSVWDANAVIMLTGYQAEHTLGRKMQEGRDHVPIFGRMHELKARVITINEFSAHADQKGLFNFVASLKNLKKVFLVHAEPEPAFAFQKLLAEKLPQLEVVVPEPGQSFEV